MLICNGSGPCAPERRCRIGSSWSGCLPMPPSSISWRRCGGPSRHGSWKISLMTRRSRARHQSGLRRRSAPLVLLDPRGTGDSFSNPTQPTKNSVAGEKRRGRRRRVSHSHGDLIICFRGVGLLPATVSGAHRQTALPDNRRHPVRAGPDPLQPDRPVTRIIMSSPCPRLWNIYYRAQPTEQRGQD